MAFAGFMRDYASILPTASHAYNFQANAYGWTNNTAPATNAASQANEAVDPTLQVLNLHAQLCIIACWCKLRSSLCISYFGSEWPTTCCQQ